MAIKAPTYQPFKNTRPIKAPNIKHQMDRPLTTCSKAHLIRLIGFFIIHITALYQLGTWPMYKHPVNLRFVLSVLSGSASQRMWTLSQEMFVAHFLMNIGRLCCSPYSQCNSRNKVELVQLNLECCSLCVSGASRPKTVVIYPRWNARLVQRWDNKLEKA